MKNPIHELLGSGEYDSADWIRMDALDIPQYEMDDMHSWGTHLVDDKYNLFSDLIRPFFLTRW
jgi:hypothetical protein